MFFRIHMSMVLRRVYFRNLADKIRNIISQWCGYSFSMAGQITLVNLMVVSMLSCSFSIYSWSRTVLHQVFN